MLLLDKIFAVTKPVVRDSTPAKTGLPQTMRTWELREVPGPLQLSAGIFEKSENNPILVSFKSVNGEATRGTAMLLVRVVAVPDEHLLAFLGYATIVEDKLDPMGGYGVKYYCIVQKKGSRTTATLHEYVDDVPSDILRLYFLP